MQKRKKAMAISIIGGADGPTSVFLAGKRSDGKGKKISFRQKRNVSKKNKRLGKLQKRLRKAGIESHTLEELEEYICAKYGAVAISQDSVEYQRALKSVKSNLVFRFFEDLIPMEHPAFPENDLTPEELQKYNEKIQEWFKAVEEVELPDEEISFHYYKIEVLNGKNKAELLLEFELKHQLLSISSCYNSNNKSLYKKVYNIIKDIYFYYGVTEEEMDEGSERFMTLAAMLQYGKERKVGRRKKRRRWIWYFGFFFLIFVLIKRVCKKISLLKNA